MCTPGQRPVNIPNKQPTNRATRISKNIKRKQKQILITMTKKITKNLRIKGKFKNKTRRS
jgi:hypothetical protein